MNKKDINKIKKECGRCKYLKPIEGHNMCNPCLRRTKRETKPSFYLGTCFSEMTRRVSTYDKLRPNYFKKEICTKTEFMNKFLTDNCFLNLYKKWQESGFKRKSAPSIDRINNRLGYSLDNLRFISHYENSTKDIKIPIKLENQFESLIFQSCTEACEFLKIQTPYFCRIRKTKGFYKGWNIYEL